MIQYLRHKEIDKAKWDACISESFNGRIYACSWYLDIMSPGWDALIEGDYERVMPLTRKCKFGIKYLYQPYYTQQLGVFSKIDSKPFSAEHIFASIPKHFRYIDIDINSDNIANKYHTKKRETQELPLYHDYPTNLKHFSKKIRNDIKKANKAGIIIQRKRLSAEQLVHLIKCNYKEKKLNFITDKIDFEKIKRIINYAIKNDLGVIYNSINKTNEINCAALFIVFNGRARIFSGQTLKGKQENAKKSLINQFIKDYAGKDISIDFGGSEIPGVAYFNKGFGAKTVNYYHFNLNRLPFFIKGSGNPPRYHHQKSTQ